MPGAPRLAAPGGDRARARREVGVRAKTSRTVSLNGRMLENPAAKATSPNGSVGRLDQQPGGLRSLRPGQRDRSGAELGEQCRSNWRVL